MCVVFVQSMKLDSFIMWAGSGELLEWHHTIGLSASVLRAWRPSPPKAMLWWQWKVEPLKWKGTQRANTVLALSKLLVGYVDKENDEAVGSDRPSVKLSCNNHNSSHRTNIWFGFSVLNDIKTVNHNHVYIILLLRISASVEGCICHQATYKIGKEWLFIYNS